MSYAAAFIPLADVYLEDSWVLEVSPSAHGIAFHLDVVLVPGHPSYEAPRPGEQYCYRTAWLDLASDQVIELELSGRRPTTDPDGSGDYGNIDRLEFDQHQQRWVIEGDWGRATIHAPTVALRWD
jgi:hypothetical protein